MRIELKIATAIAAFALLALPPAMAQNQQQQQQQQKKKPQARPQQPRVQHQRVQQPRVQQQHRVQQPRVQQNQHVQQQPKVQQPKIQQQRVQQNNQRTRSRTVTTNNRPPRQVNFSGNRQTYSGIRARTWRNSGQSNFRGRNYSYWRGGPWRHRYNGSWRTYAALSALTAIAVGSATYYPYAYIDMPQDYCDGITEDGCQLDWAEVDTVEGGVAPACVAYCLWQ